VHWNGTLLSSIHKVIGWAETMTWNGVHPAVHLVDKVYQKGVKLTKEAMKICKERIERLENLPKWDVTINPIFSLDFLCPKLILEPNYLLGIPWNL
jgi:hypothetical protein